MFDEEDTNGDKSRVSLKLYVKVCNGFRKREKKERETLRQMSSIYANEKGANIVE